MQGPKTFIDSFYEQRRTRTTASLERGAERAGASALTSAPAESARRTPTKPLLSNHSCLPETFQLATGRKAWAVRAAASHNEKLFFSARKKPCSAGALLALGQTQRNDHGDSKEIAQRLAFAPHQLAEQSPVGVAEVGVRPHVRDRAPPGAEGRGPVDACDMAFLP